MACRQRRPKIELLRIVRTPQGNVVFDGVGRVDGRGAYVCGDVDHWGDGVNRGKLNHALKIEIDESTIKSLSEAITSHQNAHND
ncbi:MAG: YlxR family protein [Chloroflexi bacterium]|nr:YlxR family protein [Chloroflexota bacterium]